MRDAALLPCRLNALSPDAVTLLVAPRSGFSNLVSAWTVLSQPPAIVIEHLPVINIFSKFACSELAPFISREPQPIMADYQFGGTDEENAELRKLEAELVSPYFHTCTCSEHQSHCSPLDPILTFTLGR